MSVQWPGMVGASAGWKGEEEERGHYSVHGGPRFLALYHSLCHLLLWVREKREKEKKEAAKSKRGEKGREKNRQWVKKE